MVDIDDTLLRRLRLADADRVEAPLALARALAEPELKRVVDKVVDVVRTGAGRVDEPAPAWEWPVDWRSAAAYPAAFLLTLDEIRAEHARRGVPEDFSWDSLAELGRQLRLYRRAFGTYGTDNAWWLLRTWSGRIVTLGRLQAEYLSPGAVTLHIPETGPLAPEAVDSSLALLARHWADWYGAPATRIECDSWLLDPALAEVLPPESNIVRFQRRFELLPREGGRDSDDSVLYFVFGRRGIAVPEGLAALPRETRLQRAVVERLLRGGHWAARRGVLRKVTHT